MPACYSVPSVMFAANPDLGRQQLFPNPVPASEVWSCGNTTVHCTSSGKFVYNTRRARPEEAVLLVGGRRAKAEWYGMLDLIVHCGEGRGIHVTLDNVAVASGFAFKSVISIEQLRLLSSGVTMGPSGVSTLDGRLRFVRGSTGNYVQATRVPHAAAPSAAVDASTPAAHAAQHSAVRLLPKPTHVPTPQHPSWGRGGFSSAAPMLGTAR